MADTPISDKQCERIVLGTIMQEEACLADIGEYIDTDCFYFSEHKELWHTIKSMREEGVPIDIVMLYAELQHRKAQISVKDITDIAECADAFGAQQHALRLAHLARQRRIWNIAQRLTAAGVTEQGADELDAICSQAIDTLSGGSVQEEATITLVEATNALYDRIAANNDTSRRVGTPTGFYDIDKRGGLQPNTLAILAGETSMGKTSFANAIVMNATDAGKKVAYFSMEMEKDELAARFIAMRSGIPASNILYKPMGEYHRLQIAEAEKKVHMERVYLDTRSTASIDNILASIRRMKIRHGIDGVVIDYLQILNVNTKNTNKEQAMADIARRLKNTAKELGIWVLALSQLNRDNLNPQPTLNRLRDSGQIAEAADIVMFVYRPEVYTDKALRYPEPFNKKATTGTALIDIAKGRNIGRFRFLCRFDANTTHFINAPLADIKDEATPAPATKGTAYGVDDTPF